MSIQDLPIEVMRMIFLELPRNSASICSYVCKSWHVPATDTFYNELVLTPRNMCYIPEILRDRKHLAKLSRATKTLLIENDEECDDDECDDDDFDDDDFYDDFNVQEKVQNILHHDTFLGLLSKLTNLKKLDLSGSSQTWHYSDLLFAVNAKRMPSLEVFLPGEFSPFEESILKSRILQVYDKFYKSMKYIIIGYKNLVNTERTISGASLLSKYKCLTELVVEDDSIDSNSSCVDLLNACPNLVKLTFTRKCQVPDSVFNRDNNCKPTRLKSLKLEIPTLTNACVKYLLRCVVSDHLENFDITLTSENYISWVNRENEDLLLKFAAKLSTVKIVRFNFRYPPHDVNISPPFPTANSTKIYSVMNALNRNRQVEYCALFTDNDNRRLDPVMIMVDKHTSTFNEIKGCLEDGKLDWLMPNTSISMIGPEILNNVSFNAKHNVGAFAPHLLRYMIANCPNIKTGNITTENPYSRLNLIAKETAFDLALHGPFPSQEFIRLLSTYVPQTKSLKILRGGHSEDKDDLKFSLDLTCLKGLKSVSIGINYAGRLIKDNFCAQFKFPDSDVIHSYVFSNYPKAPVHRLEKIAKADYDSQPCLSSHKVFIVCPRVEKLDIRVTPQKVFVSQYRMEQIAHFQISFDISK
ncbi:uncharacterized protein EV154DRAFT_598310 [Mucor mucedo]|uniref:uncharacterized protein n=1 Tax=Mucor mucedo TaxID=29922 RepID=UPI002220C422|nr:uncharacterized protein EV154DRAFT_598310 [Mucor mucedo]KAI7896350.1 hypothetical protein EV154DRAFT_598310 [Mucor mucedo]